jgi:hypothetical protein
VVVIALLMVVLMEGLEVVIVKMMVVRVGIVFQGAADELGGGSEVESVGAPGF